MQFYSPALQLACLDTKYRSLEIEQEPMFVQATWDFAYDNGSKITHAFLKEIAKLRPLSSFKFENLVIDSRTHMLKPGWYPCIPGWHHDDVPRPQPLARPDYENPWYHSKHIMMVIDSSESPTGSLTEFIQSRTDVPWPLDERASLYGVWDAHLSKQEPEIYTVDSGVLVYFDMNSFHRGVPARKDGWRFFIRASWDTGLTPQNKIRKNANVYVPWATAGW